MPEPDTPTFRWAECMNSLRWAADEDEVAIALHYPDWTRRCPGFCGVDGGQGSRHGRFMPITGTRLAIDRQENDVVRE
jgi:hypothetical protein